jgi:hypothetical protein
LRGIFGFAIGAFVLLMFWLLWARGGVNFANQQLMWQGSDPATAGQWGDSFGAFNALLGAVGTAAIVATLVVQGLALRDQRFDTHKQRFEGTFFEMMKLISTARSEVRFMFSDEFVAENPEWSQEEVYGAIAFRLAYREIGFALRQLRKSRRAVTRSRLVIIYNEHVHSRFESSLGVYFRLVYSLLDRIETDPFLSEREKDQYGNLVRGQFSAPEAAIAGCNALTPAAKDFDRLVIRFRLLKYVRNGVVKTALQKHYPAATFIGRDAP